jgi:predicted ATPase with chaperone activity
MRLRVEGEGQTARAHGRCDGQMKAKELREPCDLNDGAKELLKAALAPSFNVMVRQCDRSTKVSRTIADMEEASNIEMHMEEASNIEMHHVAEAVNYRRSTGSCLGQDEPKKKAFILFRALP